jgi:SOS response regulatory protein OraA/RecX
MGRKKLDRKVVDDAINEAFEKMPEGDLIDTAIEKRLRIKGKPDTREDVKKFYDHLMRQGFGYGLIRERMQSLAGRDFELPPED